MSYHTILLIDDDEDDQELFLKALQKTSTSVSFNSESNAALALQKLMRYELAPDVIFLDLNMPIMNGQQFLVEIKKCDGLKEIPVIIFSTSSNRATIDLTIEFGASQYITKPDTFDGLVSALSGVFS